MMWKSEVSQNRAKKIFQDIIHSQLKEERKICKVNNNICKWMIRIQMKSNKENQRDI